MRTHTCGELAAAGVGKKVKLCGWVANWRDHGEIVFIDLRDRYGITQLVFRMENDKELTGRASKIRSETVLAITGTVAARDKANINPDMPTGEIEIAVESIDMEVPAETPPFEVVDAPKADELVRLEHRYLDLRSKPMQEATIAKHKVLQATRRYFDGEDFLEIETPVLWKSTPEGARDYLVPARKSPGRFFALPQSPQMHKQLFMISGFDRYFQIARCFRDEDLRYDRQPEFTQIDIEMSFVSLENIYSVLEGLMAELTKVAAGKNVSAPFPRMTYNEAMERYGTDKPDTRFGLEIVDATNVAKKTEFKVFQNAGMVAGIRAPGGAALSRKEIDALPKAVADTGAKGVAWLKKTADGISGGVSKFFPEPIREELFSVFGGAEENDLFCFVADSPKVARASSGVLRGLLAKRLGLIDEEVFNYLWVTDFPLFEEDDEGKLSPAHHPFTSFPTEYLEQLERGEDLFSIPSHAADLVLNGVELGSGSIRIHDPAMQSRVFKALGFSEQELEDRFGFFLNAFRYGAPPHGGFALGFDRVLMCLLGRESIRDFIAFPKTTAAKCPLTGAPTSVSDQQLEELRLKIRKDD
ncbi:MAG: aspartate--tRNA ligase [Planctomycetota bacterium]|nr:MAG: aspartate--tRNA ligase [Planctomycetota bacterium]